MIRSLILGSVISVISVASFAAVESVSISDAKTLREKLTGQKYIIGVNKNSQKSVMKTPIKKAVTVQKTVAPKTTEVKSAPLKPSQKGLALAREAKNKKNYILAIKRYNFILKHFANTPEGKLALLDKAAIYKDMGLEEQATYNKIRASKLMTSTVQTGTKIKK